MNLLLILLPFVVFASSEANHTWADEMKIGKEESERLAMSLNRAVTGRSHERPADYLADYFVYRHCDLTFNKEQMLLLTSELVFDVDAGYRDMAGSMLIHAVNPKTYEVMRIRVQENNGLLGGYLIQQIVVFCRERGFAL